ERARDEHRAELALAVEHEQARPQPLERLEVGAGSDERARPATVARPDATLEDRCRNARELRRRDEPLELVGVLDARIERLDREDREQPEQAAQDEAEQTVPHEVR